jgi:Flp pilus assembly protein TadD
MLGAVLFGRYGFPNGGGEELPGPDQTDALAEANAALIAQLLVEASQNPDDAEVLFDLGETYFQAGQWQPAIDWFGKLLEIDPSNLHAYTDVGTSHFNLGQYEEAKAAWLDALEIDPDDVQAHYNLGFLYANAEPLDLVAARQEWQTTVDLAPDSELASIAQAHLDGLEDVTEDDVSDTSP